MKNIADTINAIVEVEKQLCCMSESMKINFEGTPYQSGLVAKLDDASVELEFIRVSLVKAVIDNE